MKKISWLLITVFALTLAMTSPCLAAEDISPYFSEGTGWINANFYSGLGWGASGGLPHILTPFAPVGQKEAGEIFVTSQKPTADSIMLGEYEGGMFGAYINIPVPAGITRVKVKDIPGIMTTTFSYSGEGFFS